MNIRKNIWTIEADATDETLEWYGKAIGEMKALPINDARSWRWQAAIHEYRRASDPFGSPTDTLPSTSDQRKFWDQCQHGSWFFIPWHRMYLHHFETIVRAFVVDLGGPIDWALPYWNYGDGPESRLLPPSFREELLTDGSSNHLFVAQRTSRANAGLSIADSRDVDVSCLTDGNYTTSAMAGRGFGGGATGFSHSGPAAGTAEITPHGSIHMAVNGFMGRFYTAALDPIFWCHHCNIDRLWDVWVNREADHVNPPIPSWLRGVKFDFKDVNYVDVEMACENVVNTSASPLEYVYEDISDPIPEGFGLETAVDMTKTPELVCASRAPLELRGDTPNVYTTLEIPPSQAGGDMESFGIDDDSGSVEIHLENLTSEHSVRGFDLYLGVPPGEDPSNFEDRFVARVPLFGLPESSIPDGPHAGSGLSFNFDVTNLVKSLNLVGEIPVAFRAIDGSSDVTVKVGRISFYKR